jgi:hypothetical protein
MFVIAGKYRDELYLQIVMLLCIISIFYLGNSVKEVIYFYSIFYSSIYIFVIYAGYKYSKGLSILSKVK